MKLEPEIAHFIAHSESLYTISVDATIAEQRAAYDRLCSHFTPPHPPGLHNRFDRICDIPVRRYWRDDTASGACIVFFHGGGFVVGGLHSHDFFCAKLATDTDCQVVSVDYRLAPEHPFPAAFDDCCAVLNALQTDPQRYRVDVDKLLLCGDSAGGNLVAAAALANRDRGNAPLLGQIMIYPVLAWDMNLPSYTDCAEAPLLTRADVSYYHEIYAGHLDGPTPYSTPACANRFDPLPPALLLPVEYDPLRDDAFDYHAKLRAAGTPSQLHLGEGLVHGCLRAIAISPGVQLLYKRVLDFVGDLHQPS